MERYQGLAGPALVIQHTGQVFPLTQAPVTIGRQADNAMILSDPQVSRRHATVFWQAGSYFVQDLNSANGTFVNERRIAGTQPLNHGDMLRLGNTVLEVHVAPLGPATEQVPLAPSPTDNRPSSLLPILIGLLVAGILIACLAIAALLLLDQLRARPSVAIQSPLPGAQVLMDSEVTLAAVATGVRNITLLELRIDDTVVASTASPDPRGTASLTISKPWRFAQPGPHVVSAVAYSARGSASAPATVDLMVVTATATPSPTVTPAETEPTLTPLPPTPTQPGPTIPLPTETATSTPMPTDTPRPTTTPTTTPTKVPAPQIEYFRASPSNIAVGACATLEWGSVTNASAAVIDHGIGGVGTPGATPVCPNETTTYIMTATGPGGITTASATVTVGAGLPDLSVASIVFDPSPPAREQPTQVRITLRNSGGTPAGAFGWEWLAGAEARFDGRLGGLNAGESTTVGITWTPANAYDNLVTIARADIANEVAEADESNNALQVNTAVVESALGDLELQDFFLSVDSQIVLRVSNPGGRIASPTFDYHLYQDGTLVASGSRPTPPMGTRPISTGYVLSGEHRIRAVIDPENLVAESNEGNNELTLDCSSASLICSPPP